MSKARDFSEELAEHVGCDGELELVDAETAGETALRCSGCGKSITHHDRALDPGDLAPQGSRLSDRPALAKVAASLAGSYLEIDHVDPEEFEQTTSPRSEPVPDGPVTGVTYFDVDQSSIPRKPSASRIRQRGLLPVLGYGLLAILVLGTLALAGVLLSDSGRDSDGRDGGEAASELAVDDLGPITAEVPEGWSGSAMGSMGEVTFEPLRGEARVVVQTRSGEEDLESAIEGVPDFLNQLEPSASVEDSKLGARRASLRGSYDDGQFDATVRAEGTVTVAVAIVGGAADDALSQQALDLATSVRAGS